MAAMRVLRALTLLGGAAVLSARALTDLRRQYGRIDRMLSRLEADVARMETRQTAYLEDIDRVRDTAHELELLEERVTALEAVEHRRVKGLPTPRAHTARTPEKGAPP